jgi:hypothetical protein
MTQANSFASKNIDTSLITYDILGTTNCLRILMMQIWYTLVCCDQVK